MESSHHTGMLTSVARRQPPKLLDQVPARMCRLGLAKRTEEAYVGWIRRFILAHGKRRPRAMGEREVESFLTDLAVRGRVAASIQAQALSALLFLYRAARRRTAVDGEHPPRQAARAGAGSVEPRRGTGAVGNPPGHMG